MEQNISKGNIATEIQSIWCKACVFSDNKQKHVCKVRKIFGCVL